MVSVPGRRSTAHMRNVTPRFALCVAALLTAALAVVAPAGLAPARAADQPAPAAMMQRTERLAAFMPEPAPIDLHGRSAERELYFNLSTRIEPRTARLHLEGANSDALLTLRSQLLVRLNGVVVAQLALKSGAPILVADIDLPVELLRGGGNRLTLAVAQHYTNECEDESAAELWTQIDTTRSWLTVSGAGSIVAPHLSDLQNLLSPAMFGGHRFTLLTAAAPGSLDDTQLATGAVLAEALGLRLRYKPAEIGIAAATAVDTKSPLLRLAAPALVAPALVAPALAAPDATGEAADLVLFGTRDSLRPFLGPAIADGITSGFLGVYPLPGDPRTLVLVVSGLTETDVARAAQVLAVANFPFVDAPSQRVDHLALRPDSVFFARNDLREDTRTPFSDLGFQTTTLRGREASSALDVVLPADLYAPDSANVRFSLDFAYGAGFRRDSAVNIMLNGQFQQAIPLDDPNGAVLRGYRVDMPLAKFRAGHNSIRFDVVMTPSGGGACVPPQTRNLVFALQDTSFVTLPAADHIAAQPDLRLFSATGFPYTAAAGMDVALGARDPSTIGAGWTVLARLAQVTGRLMPGLHVAFGPPSGGRHILLIGAAPDLEPALIATAPVGLQPGMSFPYASAAPDPVVATSWAQTVSDALGIAVRAEEPGQAAPAHADVTRIGGSGDIGQNGLLIAYRSPLAADRTLTVLTAATRQRLWTAAQELVQPAVWYQLDQNVTIWRPASDAVFAQRVGPMFHLGAHSTLYAARYLIGQFPVAWVAAVLASAVVLAGALRLMIVRRRRRAFPGSTEGVL